MAARAPAGNESQRYIEEKRARQRQVCYKRLGIIGGSGTDLLEVLELTDLLELAAWWVSEATKEVDDGLQSGSAEACAVVFDAG
jgi:hypothetical protein